MIKIAWNQCNSYLNFKNNKKQSTNTICHQ